MTQSLQSSSLRLFALLRTALFDEPLDSSLFASCSFGEWEHLFRQSVVQQVAALAWEAVERLPEDCRPSRPIDLYWRAEYQRTIDGTQHRQQVARRLVTFFADQDIKTYLLKGVRISACYPKPALRLFNDIDIYQGGDWQRADQMVRDQLGIQVSQVKHHHTTYVYEGETIENHYHLLNHYKYRSNIRFEREMMRFFGTPTFDALFLLRHTAAHFGVDRILLRHVCDWAMFVRKHEADVDWSVVKDFCRRYRMDRFLGALMGLIEDQLHYASHSLPAGRDQALQARVLTDILSVHAKKGRLGQFFRNYWKFRITFSDSLPSALLSRTLSLFTHGE